MHFILFLLTKLIPPSHSQQVVIGETKKSRISAESGTNANKSEMDTLTLSLHLRQIWVKLKFSASFGYICIRLYQKNERERDASEEKNPNLAQLWLGLSHNGFFTVSSLWKSSSVLMPRQRSSREGEGTFVKHKQIELN